MIVYDEDGKEIKEENKAPFNADDELDDDEADSSSDAESIEIDARNLFSDKPANGQNSEIRSQPSAMNTERTKANPRKVISFSASATMTAGSGNLASSAFGMFGFRGGGVVAGSVAAGIQSVVGNVAGGSIFATRTSFSTGSARMASVSASVQGAGIAMGAMGAGAAIAGNRGLQQIDDEEDEDEDEDEDETDEYSEDYEDEDDDDDDDDDDDKEPEIEVEEL